MVYTVTKRGLWWIEARREREKQYLEEEQAATMS